MRRIGRGSIDSIQIFVAYCMLHRLTLLCCGHVVGAPVVGEIQVRYRKDPDMQNSMRKLKLTLTLVLTLTDTGWALS